MTWQDMSPLMVLVATISPIQPAVLNTVTASLLFASVTTLVPVVEVVPLVVVVVVVEYPLVEDPVEDPTHPEVNLPAHLSVTPQQNPVAADPD